MKSSRLGLLILAAAMVAVIIAIAVTNQWNRGGVEPPTEEKIEVLNFNFTLEVVEEGLPPKIVASKKLDFGQVPQGMDVKKEIMLHNSKKNGVAVVSDVEGDSSVAEWISFEFKEFSIEPGRDFGQTVYLEVPLDAELGNYTGNVKFTITEISHEN